MRWSLLAVLMLSIVALPLPVAAHQPAPGVQLLSRSDQPGGVAVSYLIISKQVPMLTISDATHVSIAIVSDGAGGWRTTVSALLDRCMGTIALEHTTMIRQQCVYFPIGARP